MNPTPAFQHAIFAGQSTAVTKLRLQVARIAPHFRSALLVGEPGAGKAEIARELHAQSAASALPFAVEMPGDGPKNKTALAGGGTLYVPRLAGWEAQAQATLLAGIRALQHSSRQNGSELRLIFSVESAPRGLVASGRLRPDLHACASAVEIRVCPLREREEDLHLIALALASLPLEPEAVEALRSQRWPGNLEQMKAALEHGVHLARVAGRLSVRADDLQPQTTPEAAAGDAEVRLDSVLRRHVADVLERCEGNKLRAAELLGISRSTLYRMLDAA